MSAGAIALHKRPARPTIPVAAQTPSFVLVERKEYAAMMDAENASRAMLAALAAVVVAQQLDITGTAFGAALTSLQTLDLRRVSNEAKGVRVALQEWARAAVVGVSLSGGFALHKQVIRDGKGRIVEVIETPRPLDGSHEGPNHDPHSAAKGAQ